VTEIGAWVPPLVPQEGSPAEALVLALTGQNRAGAVPFGSEAGLFQAQGIPAVLCGPGSVRQAHQPNEFVETAQIDACEAFLKKLIAWAAEAR
jgi:acetylornithine deacetylase